MNIALTKKSSNAKVGKIPVTTSSKKTCPDSCPLLNNGCYASAGFHTNLHWDKVTSGERGVSIDDLCKQIQELPVGQLWRHNVAGDLIGNADKIDKKALNSLVKANKGRLGFTYTHYPMTKKHNVDAIRKANAGGFVVNISANNPEQARTIKDKLGLPVVTVVSSDFWQGHHRQQNIVRCPAETNDAITCKTCKLCARQNRSDIVGFTVHGSKTKQAEVIARG